MMLKILSYLYKGVLTLFMCLVYIIMLILATIGWALRYEEFCSPKEWSKIWHAAMVELWKGDKYAFGFRSNH